MSDKRLSAVDVLADIRAGLSDSALMEKYRLSAKGLEHVFTKLVGAGLISQMEIDRRLPAFFGTVALSDDFLQDIIREADRSPSRPPKSKSFSLEAFHPDSPPSPDRLRDLTPVPIPRVEPESAAKSKPTINGKEILQLIHSGMRDEELMQRYKLSAKGLDSLLRKMVAAGLLTREAYDVRASLRQGSSVVVDFTPVFTCALKWKFAARDVVGSPLVHEGVVYVGSWDGNLYAVDLASGEEIWRFSARGAAASRPTVLGRVVLFGSADHHMYCLDRTSGAERWRFKTGGQILSSPVVVSGLVIFGSNDEHVYAVNSDTGKEVWHFKTKGPVAASPVFADGLVLIGSDDGTLYALKPLEERFSVHAVSE
jgi:uncharacterized protein (DUF433 family)